MHIVVCCSNCCLICFSVRRSFVGSASVLVYIFFTTYFFATIFYKKKCKYFLVFQFCKDNYFFIMAVFIDFFINNFFCFHFLNEFFCVYLQKQEFLYGLIVFSCSAIILHKTKTKNKVTKQKTK